MGEAVNEVMYEAWTMFTVTRGPETLRAGENLVKGCGTLECQVVAASLRPVLHTNFCPAAQGLKLDALAIIPDAARRTKKRTGHPAERTTAQAQARTGPSRQEWSATSGQQDIHAQAQAHGNHIRPRILPCVCYSES